MSIIFIAKSLIENRQTAIARENKMLYQPKPPKKMWDCTVFYQEPVYHIFYLSSGNIGHAATEDFITYIEYPDINGFGKPGSWNQNGVPLTGAIVKDGEIYKMLLGAVDPKSSSQVYGLYISKDLIRWNEYKDNPVLVSDGELYEDTVSSRDDFMFTAWRDPYILPKEDGYYTICLCARLKKHPSSSTGAAIAKLRSKDLIHFEYCPPFTEVGSFTKYAECPNIFSLAGNIYATFLDHSWGGLRTHTASRVDPAGTFYQIYEPAKNKFVFPKDCLLIGNANNRQCAWAARTVVGEGGKRLIYYHITAEYPSFGIPKEIDVQQDKKSLKLKYFSGMDSLYGESIRINPASLTNDGGNWSFGKDIIYGKIGLFGSALPIAEAENFILDSTILLSEGNKVGIACWHSPKEEAGAAAVWLDFRNQRIMAEWEHYRAFEGFGDLQNDVVNGGMLRERDEKKIRLIHNTPYSLKIIARNNTLDVYLNDGWMLCKSFPMCSGVKISLILEKGKAAFQSTKVFACKELRILN